jgi:hypothetical protein
VQIGAKLLPTLTDMLSGVTELRRQHIATISLELHQQRRRMRSARLAGVHDGSSASASRISAMGCGTRSRQGSRNFLTKFTLGERAIKFLFGFSPIEVAVKFAEKAVGGAVE